MIALLLAAAAFIQPSEAPRAAEIEEEIVVVGNRLKAWRGRITPAGTGLRCVTATSSGDAEVDRIGCGAMVTCFTRDRATLTAEASRRRQPTEQSAAFRAMGLCVRDYHDAATAALAERRYQARQGK